MGRLRTLYHGIMEKRFARHELPEGFEIAGMLEPGRPYDYMGRTDGGLTMNVEGCTDFALGKSVLDILTGEATLPELQTLRDYGAVIDHESKMKTFSAYGKMIHITACAKALVDHGDPLTTLSREEQLDNVQRALRSNVVPKEIVYILRDARKLLEDGS